jgi:hypothetical protein
MALTSAASLTGRSDGGVAPVDWPERVGVDTGSGFAGPAPPCLDSVAGPSTARIGVTAVMAFPLVGVTGD